MTRVTEVLAWVGNEELSRWRGRVGNKEANRIGKEARGIGTQLHSYVEARLKQKEAKLPEEPFELRMACVAVSNWLDLNLIIPVGVELTIVEESLGLSGTPDLVTDTEVIDWKTSSRDDWKHIWQINAYMRLAQRQIGRIVRLDKTTGTWTEKPVMYDEEMYQGFLGLLRAYQTYRRKHGDTADSQIDSD